MVAGNIEGVGEKIEVIANIKPSNGTDKDNKENMMKLNQPRQEESGKGIQKGTMEVMTSSKRKAFVKLQDIHPYSKKWNLQARVQQKNPIFYYSSKKKLKMLLIDSEGTRMEACVYDKDVDKFDSKIHEGKVYSFVGVNVSFSPPEYKLADQKFECLLTKDTILQEDDSDHGIPDHSFDLKAFDALHPFVGRKSLLIDTIGVVRDVTAIYYRMYGDKNIPKRDIILVDKTLKHKKLILSGTLATADEDEWEIAATYSTVILATALLVNSFQDTEYLCTTINSRLMFEPSSIDVDEFRVCVVSQLGRSKIVLVNTGGSNKKAIDLEDAVKITVSDLKDISNLKNGVLYEIVGDISKVYHVPGRDFWYMSCVTCCTKLVEGEDTNYRCYKCNVNFANGCLRFILKLEIIDHTTDHDVTIFGSVADRLLGCTPKSLHDMKNQDNYGDMLVEKLKSITWMKYNFFLFLGAIGSNSVNVVHIKRRETE